MKHGKKYSKNVGYFCTFQKKKLTKVNCHPTGINLPNLVTLVEAERLHFSPGLPDFYWYNLPKREKYSK
jgi:hypothetical protein